MILISQEPHGYVANICVNICEVYGFDIVHCFMYLLV